MNHIKLAPHQEIILIGTSLSLVADAINEAIEFCQANNTKQCDLEYNGFTFGIEPDSDVKQLVEEYKNWLFIHE